MTVYKRAGIWAWCVIGLCLFVILGWQMNIILFRSIIPGAPQTTPLTAIMILGLGLALLFLKKADGKSILSLRGWVYKALAIFSVLIASWTIIQYIFRLSPGIDLILYRDLVIKQSNIDPGRPSVKTAISVLILGVSIFFVLGEKKRSTNISLLLSSVALILPWFALFGYTTLMPQFYSMETQPEIGMSPITAVMCIFLSVGIMHIRPDKGMIGLLRASTSGGTITRILLPIVTIIPLIFSFFISYFGWFENSGASFGVAFIWGINTIIMATAIISGGSIIHRKDLENKKLISNLEKIEERFRTLIETSPDATVIVDKQGRVTLINKQTERLFGYSRDELVGQSVETLLPGHLAKKHIKHRSDYTQNPVPRGMGEGRELKGQRKDGTEFTAEISLSPLQMDSEMLVNTSIRDVTYRKRHEEEINQHVENLELVKEFARIGYYETDIELSVFNVSNNFRNMFGTENNKLTNTEFIQLIHPKDALRFTNDYRKFITGKKSFQSEFRMMNKKNGEILYIKNFSYLKFKKEDVVDKVIGLSQDITLQKKMEASLLELNQSLEERVKERTAELEATHRNLEKIVEQRTEQLRLSNGELEAFSYSVSHDLRAPLRAIAGYSNMLQKDYFAQLDDEGKRIISVIIRNTNRMGQLIDDILAFSRLNRYDISHQKLDMSKIFRDVYRELATLIKEPREIEFHVDDLPGATGDRQMLTQVVINLVSNAIKYTRPKDKALIFVGCRIKNAQNIYYIQDNGVGFDERHKSKLFEVFHRLHKDSEFEGTGIGLAIVQRIIHKHSGQVWGESVLGEGATFYFTLPEDHKK